MREGRRQDPVRELAQFGRRLFRVGERLLHQRRPVFCSRRQRPLRELERDHRVDEALLRAVVQIADDPPALVVGGSGDARARRSELGLALRVRNGRRDQIGELRPAGARCRATARSWACTAMTPHRLPSTVIGLATVETMPSRTERFADRPPLRRPLRTARPEPSARSDAPSPPPRRHRCPSVRRAGPSSAKGSRRGPDQDDLRGVVLESQNGSGGPDRGERSPLRRRRIPPRAGLPWRPASPRAEGPPARRRACARWRARRSWRSPSRRA